MNEYLDCIAEKHDATEDRNIKTEYLFIAQDVTILKEELTNEIKSLQQTIDSLTEENNMLKADEVRETTPIDRHYINWNGGKNG